MSFSITVEVSDVTDKMFLHENLMSATSDEGKHELILTMGGAPTLVVRHATKGHHQVKCVDVFRLVLEHLDALDPTPATEESR